MESFCPTRLGPQTDVLSGGGRGGGGVCRLNKNKMKVAYWSVPCFQLGVFNSGRGRNKHL